MFTDVNKQNEGESDISGSPQFVGRHELLEDIKTRLTPDRRLAQLIGQPMVGKARIAKQVQHQVMKEAKEKKRDLKTYEICCRGVTDWEDVLNNFQNAVDLNDVPCTEAALLTKLKNVMKAKHSHIYLFSFIKCEDLGNENSSLSDKFDTLITKLTEISKQVFVIVTTQKVFTFRGVKNNTMKIPPMTSEESETLFKRCLNDVDVEPFLPAVETLCSGLPSLIIEAAFQLDLCLSESDNVTPEDFEETLNLCLQNSIVHPSSNGSILRVFDGLNQTTKNTVIDLSIFRGSFGIEYLEVVFDKKYSQMKALVAKLEQCSQLVRVTDTNRFRIHPAVEHHIRNLPPRHVTFDDTVRLRYVKLFGRVLKKVDTEITHRPEQHVYQHLHPDWSNFQHLLKEAIHCTQDTYEPFLQVANDAETVLIKFFPEESLIFYEAMVEASTHFGNDEEQAKQKWLLGKAKTRGKGTEYDDAMDLFKNALPVLRQSDDYYAYISLLADMAYNYYRRGYYKTALGFYEQALEKALKHESSDKLLNKVLSIRCDTAIQLIFLNEPDRAEILLKTTMEKIVSLTPHHPSIAIMINSLGLICERAHHDNENALRNYTSSLYERRKYATLAPADLVVALNNVAMQHSKRGSHEYALKLLNEALSIRKKLGWKDYNTGLTCFHLGRVHMTLGNFEEALEHTIHSLEIFRTCTKKHHVQSSVLMSKAHCLAGLHKWNETLDCLKEAVLISEMYHKQCPSDEYFLLAKKHLFVVMQSHQEEFKSVFESMKSKIHRQISECKKKHEADKQLIHHRRLLRLCEAEKTVLFEDFNSANDVNDILSNCDICTALIQSGIDAYKMWRDVQRQVVTRDSLFQQLCLIENTDTSDIFVSNLHESTGSTDVKHCHEERGEYVRPPHKQDECLCYKPGTICQNNLQVCNKTPCNTSSDSTNKTSTESSGTNNLKFSNVDKDLGIKLSLLSQGDTKDSDITAKKNDPRCASDQKENSELTKKQNLNNFPHADNSVETKTKQTYFNNYTHTKPVHIGNSVFPSGTASYNDESHVGTVPIGQRSPSWPPSQPNYYDESRFEPIKISSPTQSFTTHYNVDTHHELNDQTKNDTSVFYESEFLPSRRQPVENDDRGA